MSHITYIELKRYLPSTVKGVVTIGDNCWISEVNESTVLKYPLRLGVETERFQAEYEILTILRQHPLIIRLKGYTDDRIYLERVVNGNMRDFLTKKANNATISL
jgi:hypothetical protein